MDAPPCGVYCPNCVAYQKNCIGCVEAEGKPYYLQGEKESVCPVWECARSRNAEHCGLCEHFPCETYLGCYSPRRGIVTVLRRAGSLALRKKIGTQAWKEWLRRNNIQFGT